MNKLLSYQEMLDISAGLYKKYYTDDEIKQLAAFYASPLGQKSIATQPKVVADTQGLVQAKFAEAMPAIMATVEKKIAERQKAAKAAQ